MKPCARTQNIVTQKLENETLVYDLTSETAFCLNETSTSIWGYCNGELSISEIAKKASNELNTEVSGDFVILALKQLDEHSLLKNANRLSGGFSGVSRRELIKKVGFASMAALPMISSVVAPSAASAQSLLPYLTACTSPAQCITGNCSGDFLSTPKCCVPGSVASCPPGDLVLTLECLRSQNQCNFAARYCCSNSATLGPRGVCPRRRRECRCN